MSAPIISREELPSEASLKFANELDDEMRAGLGIGELALRLEKFAARFNAPAQSPLRQAAQRFVDLFVWEANEETGEITPHLDRQFPDFATCVTAIRNALSPSSTRLPAPAPHAEVREALERIIAVDQHERFVTIECDPAGNTMAVETVDGPCAVIARAVLALPSTKSPVMQAADKAALVVEGWSDSKRDYAERVTASPVSSTDGDGK